MMQDIADQQDLAREISEAISRPSADAFDEVKTFSSLSVHKSFANSFFSIFFCLFNFYFKFIHFNKTFVTFFLLLLLKKKNFCFLMHCLFSQDELLAELEELEQEDLEENMASMSPLPSVPSSRLPAQPSRRGSKCNTVKNAKHCKT